MKISTKKTKVLCFSRKGQYTARGGEVQAPWGGIYKSRKKKIDTLISKGNAVLRELYHSVVTKRKFSNTAKLSVLKSIFVPILFFFGHFSVIDQNVF